MQIKALSERLSHVGTASRFIHNGGLDENIAVRMYKYQQCQIQYHICSSKATVVIPIYEHAVSEKIWTEFLHYKELFTNISDCGGRESQWRSVTNRHQGMWRMNPANI